MVARRLPFYGCTVKAAERLAINLQLLIKEFGDEERRYLQPGTVDIPPPANLNQNYIITFVNIHDTNRNQLVVDICSRQSLQVDGRYVQVQESDRDAAHLRDRYKAYSWTPRNLRHVQPRNLRSCSIILIKKYKITTLITKFE